MRLFILKYIEVYFFLKKNSRLFQECVQNVIKIFTLLKKIFFIENFKELLTYYRIK